jgi:hypothetical protein
MGKVMHNVPMSTSNIKRGLAVSFSALLIVSGSSVMSANAAAKSKNLSASDLVTISYPTLASLPKSGCGKIPVKYKVNKLPIDESAFYVVIEDDNNNAVGQGTWYGTNFEGSVRAMPKSGTLNIKVCRDMWTNPDEEVFYPANRGTYSIILSAVGDMSADASASFKIA